MLTSITPTGVIPGFGFVTASCNDHVLVETFFALRHSPSPPLCSADAPEDVRLCPDKSFADDQVHERWLAQYDGEVIIPPHLRSRVR